MDPPLEVLQSPIAVGIQLNVQAKTVAATTCGFVHDGKLWRKQIATTTYFSGGTVVVTTTLGDRDAVAVERDSEDSCGYDVNTEGGPGSGGIISGPDYTYEDEITVEDLQAWADSLLDSRDWIDFTGPVDLPLGGTKGWNGLIPFDYSGGSNPNDILYASFNEIDISSLLVTRSQIGWAVTKDRVPYLISWDEVHLTNGVETSRTAQTLQMGSGVWDTGFTDWTPATNVDKDIQNARFNVPWFPP